MFVIEHFFDSGLQVGRLALRFSGGPDAGFLPAEIDEDEHLVIGLRLINDEAAGGSTDAITVKLPSASGRSSCLASSPVDGMVPSMA